MIFNEVSKREIIDKAYGSKNKIYQFEELDFYQQLTLIQLLRETTNKMTKFCEIGPFNELLYSKGESISVKLRELYRHQIISVSPKSLISSFDIEDFPNNFYVLKVIYNVNVKLTDSLLKDVESSKPILSIIPDDNKMDEAYTLYLNILKKIVIRGYIKMLEDRGLKIHITADREMEFYDVLIEIGYCKIMNLCYKAARDLSDKVITNEYTFKHAVNAALHRVILYYRNAIKHGWKLTDSKPEYAEYEVREYVEKILGVDISILKQPATLEIVKEIIE